MPLLEAFKLEEKLFTNSKDTEPLKITMLPQMYKNGVPPKFYLTHQKWPKPTNLSPKEKSRLANPSATKNKYILK